MAKSINRYISELLEAYQEVTQSTCTEMALDFHVTLSNLYLYRNGKGKDMGQNLILHYQAVEEPWHDPDLGQYVTYGLRVQRKTGSGWEEIESIHDVTTQRCFAERLAKLFSRHQLSPLHFRDAIEDVLP